METLKEMKTYLKETAVTIRSKKSERKGAKFGWVQGLDDLRYRYRHCHLAYCLLRGRTMEQIERSCRTDNLPDENYVDSLMKPVQIRWKEMQEELETNV